jgi:hypothetical protein
MGCFDLFCFICGNTYHSMYSDFKSEFLGNIEYYKKNPKSRSGIKYKKYLAMYEKDPKLFDKIEEFVKKTEWMNSCTFLTVTNKIIHGCVNKSCANEFVDENGTYYTHDPNNNYNYIYINNIRGLFIHTDCWKYINQKYKIQLKFSDLPILPNKNILKDFDFVNYGEIQYYWEQNFDFLELYVDKKLYLCSSPLTKDKNISQITKNFSTLKIKGGRKGPLTSATIYNNNIYKIGNNSNIWQIKNGKWVEIKDKIVKKTITVKNNKLNGIISDIKFIGENNKKPIFVENVISSKDQLTINFIMSQEYADKFI